VGRGTEADTLLEAGINDADVIVAATSDDANNLSIIMTANQLKAEIFTVGRVSKETSRALFDRANCNYIMRRSLVVANEALTSITRPLVTKFIKFSNSLTEEETVDLATLIQSLTIDSEPVTWRLLINTDSSPELVNFINQGTRVTVGKLCANQRVPNATCIPLMLLRNGVSQIMPPKDQVVLEGDELLVCGPRGKLLLPQRLQHNGELLDSLINKNSNHIPLLRWLARKRKQVSNN
jgi:Trk K+ transport system NAD-binding subunit